MIVILCLSIYSIRSAVFIFKISGARGRNSIPHKMQKADAVPHSSNSKVISLHKHFEIVDSSKGLESINGEPLESLWKASGKLINEKYPFVSIFAATHTESESFVINIMLNSFVALSYPDDRLEIIIVDDSTDDTYQKIQTRLPDLQDLKVIHRQSRAGWKG